MLKRLLTCTIIWIAANAHAQVAFTTRDSVDINNITASIMVHGDMWWNPAAGVAACEYPAHSGKNISFAGSVWMSGYDGGGALHVAAQTYRQNGNDYWPGPLYPTDTLTYATSQNWAKIWKVKRTDIQYFQSLSTHTVANTPAAILSWPANGNTNATGNGGAALTISTDMAPFVDLNSNGIYEPLLGEYPDVPGDEALWWVFSDNGPTHTETHGKPLGVEVHAMAYAYSRGTQIDNVVYYDYRVVNRSVNNYSNFRLAQWNDIDLGWYGDDFIGYDSVHRMGIDYNGTNDDGAGAGHPYNSYGIDPPQSAVSLVVMPGDAGTSYVPAGSFMTYNNDATVIGNPTTDTQYSNYMRAETRTGVPIATYYAGTAPCAPYGPTDPYMYPGDPSNTAQWSECTCGDAPGDRRFIVASPSFTLSAGATQRLVLAQVVADSAGGCSVANFNSIKAVADTAWNIFFNPLPPPPYTGVGNVQAVNIELNVYPSPADRVLTIELAGTGGSMQAYEVMSIEGRVVMTGQLQQGKNTVSVQQLSPGMYLVNVTTNDGGRVIRKFVKE